MAKEYSQALGINFDQVFAPPAHLAALRAILAQAAMDGEYIESLDISNAYLKGELEKEYKVFMKQPEGFRNMVRMAKSGFASSKRDFMV